MMGGGLVVLGGRVVTMGGGVMKVEGGVVEVRGGRLVCVDDMLKSPLMHHTHV